MNEKYEINLSINHPKGFLCISDARFQLSIGGIRLINGVTKNEVKLLAKSMEYKLMSFEIPISGGKGGISSDDITDLYKYVDNSIIKSYITGKNEMNHQFITGPDIGTSEDQYYKALELAGLDYLIKPGLLSNNSTRYNMPLDNIITAFGVIVAMEVLIRSLESKYLNIDDDPLKNKLISIEGFGKVGAGIAIQLKERAKIVAISTKYGSLVDEKGLDVNKLLDLKEKYGDNLINYYGIPHHPVNFLFKVKTDILIPGARTEVIDKNVADNIIKLSKPQFIVPVSNYPYTNEGRRTLEAFGIKCFPDFIASSGAVLAAMIEFAGCGGEKEAFELVEAAITFETKDLLMGSIACTDSSKSIYDFALEKAMKNKELMISQLDTIDINQIAKNIIMKYSPKLLKERQ